MVVRSNQNCTESKTTRRAFVGGVATVGAIALAGCTGDSEGDDGGNGDGAGGLTAAVGSHAFDGEGTMETPEGPASVTISGYRTDDGDSYTEFTMSMMGVNITTESYIVGDTMYSIIGGMCNQSPAPDDGLDESGFVPDPELYTALEDFDHQGQTDIDGVTVDIYEVDHSEHDFEGGSGSGRIYVDPDTMQIRRVSYEADSPDGSGEFTIDFHSHGESFSVNPPANC